MTQGDCYAQVCNLHCHILYRNMQFHFRCNFAAGVNSLITGYSGTQYYDL